MIDNIVKLCKGVMFVLIGISFCYIPLFEIAQGSTPNIRSLDEWNDQKFVAMEQGLRDEFAKTTFKLYQMQTATDELTRTMLAQLKPTDN